jgi:predicted transcriptional regulator of viral defense system
MKGPRTGNEWARSRAFRDIWAATIVAMPVLRPVTPAHRGKVDTERLAKLAVSQSGVVSRAQLESVGVSDSAMSRWVQARRLHRIHPGVYAVGHAALSLDGRLIAAVLYGGDDAVFSHTTAAWLWRLIDAEPNRIHLTVPGRRSSLSGVRVHRSRDVARATCRELPVTSVARTLVDLAGMLSFRELRRALAEADYRDLLSVPEVKSELKQGRQGSRALRRALHQHLPQLAHTLSVLEERFLELCHATGLPLPEINPSVGRMRVDALWRQQGLVAELDGAAAHGSWPQASRDRERELALRRMGFRVVRYTWQQIIERPTEVVADLREQLGLATSSAIGRDQISATQHPR